MVSSSQIYKVNTRNYCYKNVNPSLFINFLIFLSTFFSFSYYYYYYLPSVAFNEGHVDGLPTFTNAIKLILLFVSYLCFFDFSIRKIRSFSDLLLLIFVFFFSIYFIAVYYAKGWQSVMFLNHFLIFIPFVLFRPRIKIISIKLFYEFALSEYKLK